MSRKSDEALKKIVAETDETTELCDKIANLERRQEKLISLLKEMADHVAIRNAMGELSREFCKGCRHGRLKPCPLPRVLKEIEGR